MAQLVELTETDRESIKKILFLLDLKQRDLSIIPDLNLSWLSQVLSGKIISANGEMLGQIADFLIEKAKDSFKAQRISDTQTREIANALNRFSHSAKELINVMPKQIFPPGEVIPATAANYLTRKVDEEILQALIKPLFTVLVHGPVQCGKTSLIARLVNIATEKGVQTAWFDTKKEIPFDVTHHLDVYERLAENMALMLQDKWKLVAPARKISSITSLVNWLLPALTPTATTPRLLVIDDLGRLGMTGVDDWLRYFVRELHNARAISDSNLIIDIRIAVGLTYGYAAGVKNAREMISSMVSWSAEILCEWFNETEVKNFITQMDVDLEKDKSLYELFGGQPYLTNFALYDKDFLNSVKTWRNEKKSKNSEPLARPIRGARAYKQHLNAVRRVILGPVWDSPNINKKVLRSFIEACKNNGEVEIEPEHEDFLIREKLLKKDKTPAMPIYRLIAEDFEEDLQEDIRRR